jgi:DNA polymerase III epsilon subunit-like protein
MDISKPVPFYRFAAVDVETTGLMPTDRVVELGLVLFEFDGFPSLVYTTFVDPEVAIPLEASRVHGIYDSMVRGAPKLEEAMRVVRPMLDSRVCVLHNATYDVRYLPEHLARPIVDTKVLAARVYPGADTSLRALESQPGPHHRAGPDAVATANLFCRLVRRLRDRWGRWPTLEEVLEP